MNREPFNSLHNAVASGPPGSGVPHQFEVVFQPRPAAKRLVLQSATDANEATMAFHEALRRLTIQRATGELLVRNSDHADHPLLRLPLTNHS
jgi:hypothetical protein